MGHFSYPACRRSSGTGLRPLSYEEKTKVRMYISKLLVPPLLTCVCACTYVQHPQYGCEMCALTYPPPLPSLACSLCPALRSKCICEWLAYPTPPALHSACIHTCVRTHHCCNGSVLTLRIKLYYVCMYVHTYVHTYAMSATIILFICTIQFIRMYVCTYMLCPIYCKWYPWYFNTAVCMFLGLSVLPLSLRAASVLLWHPGQPDVWWPADSHGDRGWGVLLWDLIFRLHMISGNICVIGGRGMSYCTYIRITYHGASNMYPIGIFTYNRVPLFAWCHYCTVPFLVTTFHPSPYTSPPHWCMGYTAGEEVWRAGEDIPISLVSQVPQVLWGPSKCVCMYVHKYVCTCVSVYVCMWVSVYVCTWVSVYVCMLNGLACLNLSRVQCVHTYVQYLCCSTYVCMYVHECTCT